MTTAKYAYTKDLGKLEFDEAERRVVSALKEQGFGVLTEIDVTATLKTKIDVDFGRRYKILGACNPKLAHRSLGSELLIGLLMPCNVVLFEEDDGRVAVAIGKPREMFKVVDNDALMSVADEVDGKLQKLLEGLEAG